MTTGKPHEMARQHYDVPDPEVPSQFVERHWLPLNTPVLDEQGQIQHIIHQVINVTEHVQAEKLLQASQVREQAARADAEQRQQQQLHNQTEKLQSAQRQVKQRDTLYQIFEQTPAAICINRGPEHRYTYINDAYQQLFPNRQLLGRPVAEALPESVSDGFVALLDHVYRSGETYFGYDRPLKIKQADGRVDQELYFTFTYQAYWEEGQVVGISTFAYDVTEQVLARRQYEARQQQLRDLFEQAPVAIAVFRGSEYVVEVANPLVAALWGRTPDQVLGKPLLEALPEVRDQGFRELLDEVVQTGKAFVAREVEATLQRQDRLEKVFLDFVYQPLRDEEGLITSVVAVAVEVSEQVNARREIEESQRQLTLANKQLTRANVDLDNFIYTASHDLKAPILNIEGLIEVLLDQLPPESLQLTGVERTIEHITGSVQRFKRTIEHLTEITKLQKENSPEASEVNLARVIAEVQLDLAPDIRAAQAEVTVEVAACPTVRFPEKNLRSVIYNLLSNAIKYRSPERAPLVRIHCHETAGYQVLTVADNGLGMDLSRRGKLFNMFTRLHDHVEGSGIGLYMVRKIVENAGGKIDVQSKMGEGSAFSVHFPPNS